MGCGATNTQSKAHRLPSDPRKSKYRAKIQKIPPQKFNLLWEEYTDEVITIGPTYDFKITMNGSVRGHRQFLENLRMQLPNCRSISLLGVESKDELTTEFLEKYFPEKVEILQIKMLFEKVPIINYMKVFPNLTTKVTKAVVLERVSINQKYLSKILESFKYCQRVAIRNSKITCPTVGNFENFQS